MISKEAAAGIVIAPFAIFAVGFFTIVKEVFGATVGSILKGGGGGGRGH